MSDNEDKTQFMPIKNKGADRPYLELYIQVVLDGVPLSDEQIYLQKFTIGRGQVNDLCINDKSISRRHLELKLEYNYWYLRDTGSTNGTFVDGIKVTSSDWLQLKLPCLVSFGSSKTQLRLKSEPFSSGIKSPISEDMTVFDIVSTRGNEVSNVETAEDLERRFLSTDDGEDIGDYTKMVRGVIAHDRKKKKKWHHVTILVSVVLLFGASILIFQQQKSIDRSRKIAIDMFYDVKMLEVDLSGTELLLKQEHSSGLQQKILEKRARLEGMQSKYQAYLDELKTMDFKQMLLLSREDELIHKVAGAFGESELELPHGFVTEVKRYIDYWQKTPRMAKAMSFMERNNYLSIMVDAMDRENLPYQFLFVSLQESNFNPRAIGPETRFGIAKGAWQFLPLTGKEFGLTPGPLSDEREFDGADERFNFEKATYSAAKYLKHIYTTEAQASGLLVMAGYNFGHNRVKKMIRKLPDNPKERNFWNFLKTYEDKIPQETRDYVFYIFSAAVIGEDPAHFGFDFKSPSSSM